VCLIPVRDKQFVRSKPHRFNGTTVFTGLNTIEKAFSEEVIAYWLSFVRAGNPNTYRLSKSPIWHNYSIRNPWRVVLVQDPNNQTTKSGVWMERTPDVESQRCRFIASKVEHEQA
jgi:Carboxylesterase family